jgi:ABC-type cobalamin transport system ATPase subunit
MSTKPMVTTWSTGLNFDASAAEDRARRSNGAGKSTLLKILADVIPIQGGVRDLGSNVIPATSRRTAPTT